MAPIRSTSLLAVALLLAIAGLLSAKETTHPRPGSSARPLSEQPAWMRRSREANLPEIESRQARTVIAYCGQCHVPPPPALRTGAEWRWMIVRMDSRATAEARAGLHTVTNDELMQIARYYERHAKR